MNLDNLLIWSGRRYAVSVRVAEAPRPAWWKVWDRQPRPETPGWPMAAIVIQRIDGVSTVLQGCHSPIICRPDEAARVGEGVADQMRLIEAASPEATP